MKITIGADPEVFVRQHGRYISAHGLIPGTKQKPYLVELGAVQVDGMALEFNIDPASTVNEFVTNIQTVLRTLAAMTSHCELAIDAVAKFSKDYMQQVPEEAKELGCDSDYNAWEQRVNEPPDATIDYRTAAGHIHIGWLDDVLQNPEDSAHMTTCARIVQQLDFYLGLPSLFYDTDTERRNLYGKAGAFRPKPYGVEYRVLSNQWLKSTERITWIYHATQDALQNLLQGNSLAAKHGDIQDVINTSNRRAAQQIIETENLRICHV